ncbi:MAG: hypothetical protein PHI31_01625 [Desulfuromonadaceae bacterium]|nr:hypothetical protein [Desulfuromonadaceae bacterium]
MVIIGKRAGQLGNRLFVFAHIIANAIEYGYEVQNPSFYGYGHYFKGTQDDFFCRFPARKSGYNIPALQKVFYQLLTTCLLPLSNFNRLAKLLNISFLDIDPKTYPAESYDMTNSEYVHLATANNLLIIKDPWLFRDSAHLQKHNDQVRLFFAPIEKHSRAIADLIVRARQDCDVLVGIHIRQGDYKRWQGGTYYFSTSEYAAAMSRFAATMPEKRIKFLICSNEKQDEAIFHGLNYIVGNDHQLEDMYAFAQCDLLIGPPSTYTLWASFYGSVPLFILKAADAQINCSEFHITNG